MDHFIATFFGRGDDLLESSVVNMRKINDIQHGNFSLTLWNREFGNNIQHY